MSASTICPLQSTNAFSHNFSTPSDDFPQYPAPAWMAENMCMVLALVLIGIGE